MQPLNESEIDLMDVKVYKTLISNIEMNILGLLPAIKRHIDHYILIFNIIQQNSNVLGKICIDLIQLELEQFKTIFDFEPTKIHDIILKKDMRQYNMFVKKIYKFNKTIIRIENLSNMIIVKLQYDMIKCIEFNFTNMKKNQKNREECIDKLHLINTHINQLKIHNFKIGWAIKPSDKQPQPKKKSYSCTAVVFGLSSEEYKELAEDLTNQAIDNDLDKKSINIQQNNEQFADDQFADIQLVDEQLADQQLADELFADIQLANEQFANEQITDEHSNADLSVDGQFADEQFVDAQSIDEQFADAQTTDEQFTDAQTTNEEQTNAQTTNEEQTNAQTTNEEQTNAQTTDEEQTNAQTTDDEQTNAQTTDDEQTNAHPNDIHSNDIQPTIEYQQIIKPMTKSNMILIHKPSRRYKCEVCTQSLEMFINKCIEVSFPKIINYTYSKTIELWARCPSEKNKSVKCNHIINLEKLIEQNNMIELFKHKILQKKKILSKEIYGIDIFIKCPKPDCPNGDGFPINDIIEDLAVGRLSSHLNPIHRCTLCNTVWCSECGESHPGRLCKKYDVVDLGPDTKKCPQCKLPTFRDGGCFHIICTHCSSHWCWDCNYFTPQSNAYAHKCIKGNWLETAP
jgi:hypothetical protein